MIQKKNKFIFFALILTNLGCITSKNMRDQKITTTLNTKTEKDPLIPKNEKEHLITVFVHGTIFDYPSIDIYKKTKKDHTTKGGFFKKYRNNLRKNDLYNCQTINAIGLLPINFNDKSDELKNTIILAKIYQKNYLEISTNKEIFFHFYTFGWSGDLSRKSREQAAESFYKQLRTQIDEIKKSTNSSNIKVEILAHSHGGNVALNLAKVEEKLKQNLSIDKLILFGTPVQSETKKFVSSSIFKKIYNLYSRGDSIQLIDMLSTKDFSSKRRFNDSENLIQVEVKVGKMHPLHTELWFLANNGNFIYRNKFPLKPLPLLVFSPIITNFVESDVNNIRNLDLHIKTKSEYLKFNFYDQDFRKKQKRADNLVCHKHSYKFKNFEKLKYQAKKEV